MTLAIYGAGKGGRLLLDVVRSNGGTVDFFIDELISIREIDGIPIIRVSDIQEKTNLTVYFTISEDQEDVHNCEKKAIDYLRDSGVREIITWSGIAEIYHEIKEFNEKCYNTVDYQKFCYERQNGLRKFSENIPNDKEISEIKSILSDQKSIELMGKLIRHRKEMYEGPLLNLPDQLTHYFPKSIDIFRGIKRLRFADCGAFNGITAKNALKLSKVPVDYVASFEPSPTSFLRLLQTFKDLKHLYPQTKFFAYSCGVWSGNEFLRLANEGVESAAIVGKKSDGSDIAVVSLDAILSTEPPNFIKLDVEGAESEALQGARFLISEYQPTLAISAYHKGDDLWKLPMLVKSLYSDYQIYIRHHHWSPLETVLYCVAPNGTKISG
ncbi:FkbM family methyltransferase [Azospirillum sp. TSH64]|uniref:FkbM family methyltransferase n=1 Tax=Azospirillum sp. TSH64 TaxID=652740 RepID=UPI000D6447AF|nr:FkbM family methyltransferase [Azospirillum sp. TSH64]